MNKAMPFSARSGDQPGRQNLLPADGEAYLIEDVLTKKAADQAFEVLNGSVDWRHERALMFGRSLPLPRLTAWYGEHGYAYSGIRHEPARFTPPLLALKTVIEGITGRCFNSVLVNLYRDGRDSMGWHSDDEPSLGDDPEIASLSLGAVRRFHFKHRRNGERITLDLRHGSCLVMRGACQANWRHQLPKTTKAIGPRINLTFRSILS